MVFPSSTLSCPLLFSLVQLMLRQSCWRDLMGVASDVTRRHSITENVSIPWFLQSSTPSSAMIPKPCDMGVTFRAGQFLFFFLLLFLSDMAV